MTDYKHKEGVKLQNLLTNSGFGVWSNSTLENVGSDLVTNGGFGSDATSWTAVDGTLASVAGGQSGNCLEITRTGGSWQDAYQALTLTVGKLYRLQAYVKSGTSGNEAYQIGITNNARTAFIVDAESTSSGSWVQITVSWEATETNNSITVRKNSATAGTMLFDTVEVYEVTPGCVAADTLGPDGWVKSTTLDLWRQHNDATYTKDGSFYSLKVTAGDALEENIVWNYNIRDKDYFYMKFQGRTVTLGTWIYSVSAADNVRVAIHDGTSWNYSSYVGADAWEWMELTVTIGASATSVQFGFAFDGDASDVCYVSQPMLVFGSSIGEGNYVQPPGEVIWFEKQKILNSYSNVTLADANDATINVEAESGGMVPKGVDAVYVRIIGICATTGKLIQLSRDSAADPITTELISQAVSVENRNSGWVPCDVNGDFYVRLNDTFTGCYINALAVEVR
jgi:hypothetical protein